MESVSPERCPHPLRPLLLILLLRQLTSYLPSRAELMDAEQSQCETPFAHAALKKPAPEEPGVKFVPRKLYSDQ